MLNALHTAIHRLQDSGPEGFEGFVLTLIERLTGRAFHLAKPGTQAGRDASAQDRAATRILIECKRYRQGTSPRSRELQGGLSEAITSAGGDLDLWLVVSSGVVADREAGELRDAAWQRGTAVEIIDWQQAGLPQLGILCAAFVEDTVGQLESRLTGLDATSVRVDLERIANDPIFPELLSDLRRRLSAAHLGFAYACAASALWIKRKLASKTDAMSAFNQALCPLDDNFSSITDRARYRAQLSNWYDRWKETPLAAVLGSEGVGKSWITLDWWRRLIGLLDEGSELAGLDRHLDQAPSYLNLVATRSARNLERNRRAREWFRGFLQECDPERAWAAFRLFLRCVDRRYYLWRDEIIGGRELRTEWQHHLSLNRHAIEHSIKDNEGKLSETLFGTRIPAFPMAPWYVARARGNRLRSPGAR